MINFSGHIISKEKEVLNSNNRAFKYGDAIFETLKIQNSEINFLEDHYFRVMASMRMLRMEIPMYFNLEFFKGEIVKTVEANNLVNARVRITVFRANGGLYKPKSHKIEFIIEASALNVEVKNKYTVDIFKDYFIFSGLLSTIKTTNKLANVLASIYASENELDNCILLNEKKQLVEATNGNVFLVKGNTIFTPAITEGCIKGIVRKKIIEIISNHPNYIIKETPISPFEIQKADEVFMTNSIVGIQPITNYKKSVFNKKIAEELTVLLKQLV